MFHKMENLMTSISIWKSEFKECCKSSETFALKTSENTKRNSVSKQTIKKSTSSTSKSTKKNGSAWKNSLKTTVDSWTFLFSIRAKPHSTSLDTGHTSYCKSFKPYKKKDSCFELCSSTKSTFLETESESGSLTSEESARWTTSATSFSLQMFTSASCLNPNPWWTDTHEANFQTGSNSQINLWTTRSSHLKCYSRNSMSILLHWMYGDSGWLFTQLCLERSLKVFIKCIKSGTEDSMRLM